MKIVESIKSPSTHPTTAPPAPAQVGSPLRVSAVRRSGRRRGVPAAGFAMIWRTLSAKSADMPHRTGGNTGHSCLNEPSGNVVEQLGAVLGAVGSVLFKLGEVAADAPVAQAQTAQGKDSGNDLADWSPAPDITSPIPSAFRSCPPRRTSLVPR